MECFDVNEQENRRVVPKATKQQRKEEREIEEKK